MTENTMPPQVPAQPAPTQPMPVQQVPVQPAPVQAAPQPVMLSPAQRMAIEARLANEKKSTLVAYLLWLFIGSTGVQNFYVGRKGLAWTELILLISSPFLAFIPLIPLGILLIYDLFTLSSAVKAYTDRRRNELILAETGIKTNI